MNNSQEKRRTRNAGFTLIEILLVVVIIGMLAGIAAVNIPKFLGQGREGKAKADISSISTALHAYNMVEGKYPSSLSALNEGNDPYMESIPKDPWGREYVYTTPGSRKGLRFDLYSLGEDGSQSGDDVANWSLDE